MRIAIDARSQMEGRRSGVEEYTEQIIRGMLRVGEEHEYHLFYNAWREVSLPHFPGATVHRFRFPNKILNASQYVFRRPRWDSIIDADIFFVPNARLLPLSLDTPYVVVAHDLSYERFPEFYSWRRRIWHRLMKPQALMRGASAVICVSTATREDVTAMYGIDKRRAHVVYSGVRLEHASVACSSALPPRYILFLGALEPRKNVVGLIEAYSAVASFIPQDLVIAGSSGWLEREVFKAIEQSSVKHRIHMIGFVSEEEKASLYSGADLFVYPSFHEGFGFPVLESLLAGTPVITSDNASLPEISGKWATLIDPYNTAELSLVLKEKSMFPPLISERSKDEIRSTYSWDRAARETLDILERYASGD